MDRSLEQNPIVGSLRLIQPAHMDDDIDDSFILGITRVSEGRSGRRQRLGSNRSRRNEPTLTRPSRSGPFCGIRWVGKSDSTANLVFLAVVQGEVLV